MKAAEGSLILLSLLALLSAGVAILIGPSPGIDWQIVWTVRLPRVFLGVLVGAGLAGAGAIYQGVLRNPLADPFILGTSSAATAGVMMAGILGLHHFSGLYLLALSFALASIFLVYRLAQSDGKTPIQTMILAGVIVSLFFNALVFLFFSVYHRESFSVLFFLLGTLTEGDPLLLSISSGLILLGLMTGWLLAPELNLLTQGEETAFHLGVEVERSKKILFGCASVMVAGAVAVAGMIGFVGLIVPHLMRLLIGSDHRRLLPASALGGAIFLVGADSLARVLLPPLEIPVGALTALIGSPYFIYLLRRHQRMGEF